MCPAKSSAVAVAVLCFFGTSGPADEPADISQAPPQLQAAVARLTSVLPHGWPVHQIDHEPSVTVDGQGGYRVVLRRTWKELPRGVPVPQQQAAAVSPEDDPRVTRHTDWDFVLFPAGGDKLANEAKRAIRWHVPDEREYRLPVALGEGHGYVWFSYATIPLQHFVRNQLMLSGGDDRLQLALRGLSVRGDGAMTRNWALQVFVEFGDEGFAALDGLIGSSEDTTNAILAMAHFRDGKATARLIELYHWPDEQVQRAAAYALVRQPYRPQAKAEYLGLLRRQLHVDSAAQACVQFDWKEALPVLAGVIEEPSSLPNYRSAFKAYRQLAGKPIGAELFSAENTLMRQTSSDPAPRPSEKDLAAARQTILTANDDEGAAFVAFCLATFTSKSNTGPINKDGIALLRALPAAALDRVMRRHLESLDKPAARAAGPARGDDPFAN